MKIPKRGKSSAIAILMSALLGGGIFAGLSQAEDSALVNVAIEPGGSGSFQNATQDVSPPTPPANLQAMPKSDHSGIKLYWNLSLDNAGVTGYAVFRNGSKIGSVSVTTYTDTSVARGVGYQYIVRARDAAGNWSDPSNTATVMIPVEVVAVTEQPVVAVANSDTSTIGSAGSSSESSSMSTAADTSSAASTSESPSDPSSGSLGTLDLNGLKARSVKQPITLINPPISKKAEQLPVKKFVPIPPIDGVEDQDGDGLPDVEEVRRGTSPLNSDTDGDGYMDSDEIKSGYNPLKFSAGDKGDKIEFQSPKDMVVAAKARAAQEGKSYVAPRVENAAYKIEKIERVKRDDGQNITRLSGQALPNALVTVYIFSDPIVVVVKTDKQGNWSYDLERDLADGDHEAYVAVTDNLGQITAQSAPLPFVKTAEAVTIRTAEAAAVRPASPMDRWKSSFVVIAVILMVSFFAMGVVLIRHFSRSTQG